MRLMTLILAAMLLATGVAGAQEHRPPAPAASGASSAELPLGEIGRLIAAAAPGATVEIPAGVYRERIRIDKPLTLVGRDNPVIDAGGKGQIVEIGAPDVTIRGFTLRNTGIDLDAEDAAIRVSAPRAHIEDNQLEDVLFGIDLRESPNSIVRNNTIGGKKLDIARRGDTLRLWRSDRVVVENNRFHDGRDAIIWYSNGVTLRANSADRCRYGLHLMFADDVTIEDNRLAENSVGVYIMYSKNIVMRRNHLVRNRGPSGYGIGFKETDRYTVEHNVIVGNRIGVYLDGSPFTTAQPGLFTFNTVASNDVGIAFLPAVRGNRIVSNNFIDNIEQVSVLGRGELVGNEFWHGETGNFWSDYVGYDEDHDGVGDFVHESRTVFENMLDSEPKLRILIFSPAQQAIEFVGRALPAIRPEPKFTDEVPLMRPVVTVAGDPNIDASPRGLAGVAGILLALGAGVVVAARPPRRPLRRLVLRSGGHS